MSMPWTRNLFEKDKLLGMLKAFDETIKQPLTIHICGGAACIISHDFRRTTMDIDVVRSDKDLRTFEKEIQAVARKFDAANNTEAWLNQGPKGLNTYLPEDYKTRLKSVEGNFKNLTVKSVSAPDIMIMKLAVRLNTVDGNLRARDFDDIKHLNIDEAGKQVVLRELDKITVANPEHGQKMRASFEGLRPDLCLARKPDSLPNLDSIVAQVKERYGLEIKPDVVSLWKENLASKETSLQEIQDIIFDRLKGKGIDAPELQNEVKKSNSSDKDRSRNSRSL